MWNEISSKIDFLKVVYVSLVNQRHFCVVVSSNFLFVCLFVCLFVLHPFRIKYGVTVSKCYVTHVGAVTSFFTKRHIWVSEVKSNGINVM